MKRTPLKRKSKSDITKIQDKIWELCKKITRHRYGNTCYTCGKTGLEGSNQHTGHLYPKAALGAYLKYDLRVLRIQCYHCNVNLGGNGAVYLENILRDEGAEYIEQIRKDKQVLVKAIDHYKKILVEYQQIADDLGL